MIIGSHVSIRNGYFGAAKTAKQLGASAFQYFPKNPRSLEVKRVNEEDARRCKRYCKENGLLSVAHAPYPTRLIVNDRQYDLVKQSIINDLEITEACGSLGVVVHFGKVTQDEDPLTAYKGMIGLINDVLRDWNGGSLLLIENNAGTIGTTLEELTQIRKLCAYPEKVGFCLDTCHLFASGVWSDENWEEVLQKGNELDFFNHVKVVHLNNSIYDTGSERDRHAQIPFGKIDKNAMNELVVSINKMNIPFILETPTSDEMSHSEEIAYVKSLIQ